MTPEAYAEDVLNQMSDASRPSAVIIADTIRAAIIEEREAVAKMADERAEELERQTLDHAPEHLLQDFADAIRARGK